MSPIPGHAPDMDLTLDFMDLVGKVERQANIASRAGQYGDLHSIAVELVEWQKRLRKALVDALGHHNMATSWSSIVNEVDAMRKERDGMQQLHLIDGEELGRMERAFGESRQELERLRREKRDADA